MLPPDIKVEDGRLYRVKEENGNIYKRVLNKNEIRAAVNSSEFGNLRLEDDESYYEQTAATLLAMARMPASVDSLQKIKNLAHNEKFRNYIASKDEKARGKRATFAEYFGFDPNSFYVSPSSASYAAMQSPDFDGDQIQLYGLNGNKKDKYIEIGEGEDKQFVRVDELFEAIVNQTQEYYRQINQAGENDINKLDAEALALTKELFDEDMKFNPKDPAMIGKIFSAAALQSWRLGAPSAIQRNAFQLPIDYKTAHAIQLAARQYDRISTSQKKLKIQDTSSEGMELLANYKPWIEFNNTLRKARSDRGELNYGVFRDKNLYKINAPLATMTGSVYSSLMARVIAKNMGYDPNPGVNWDRAFEESRTGI